MLLSQNIKTRLHYRFDFVMSLLGMTVVSVSQLFFIWVIFTNIPALAGWSYHEMFFMHAFVILAYCLESLFFDHLWQLNSHVIHGTFIKYYFKPLNMMFYYMSEVFNLKAIGNTIVGIGALLYAARMLELSWGPLQFLLFFIFLGNAALISLSINLIIACVGFWFRGTIPLIMAVNNVSTLTRYPLTIFNRFFRFLFSYILPYAFIAFYPVQILLRPREVHPLLYASPLLGFLLFSLAYLLWKKGVNAYSGTGT